MDRQRRIPKFEIEEVDNPEQGAAMIWTLRSQKRGRGE
jgi:hypothetical protein